MSANLVRYQVFISSTFHDLGPERAAVLNTILSMNHFPAGMELFPASQYTPWEIIERVIDQSDYYVLVIAGKYGSTDDNGISYTEREYNRAREKRKFVIALIHENPGELPAKSVEREQPKQRKLEEFIEKVKSHHHVSTWRTADDLAGKVALALMHAINQAPAIGWVRADGISNTALLTKNSELYDSNDKLRMENERLRRASDSSMVSGNSIGLAADRLDQEAAKWFLSLSGRITPVYVHQLSKPISDVADDLYRDGYIFTSAVDKPLVVTRPGWALRDELLRRKALVKSLPGPQFIQALPHVLECTPAEAESIADQLTADFLVTRISLYDGPAIELLQQGRIIAERLDRMELIGD